MASTAQHDRNPSSHPNSESGVALILSLFFGIIVTGVVVTGSFVMSANQKRTETQFRVNGQANQFARSGITEALAWFRRQPNQPVVDFEPSLDLAADPQVYDTDDPEIGIMREFRIAGPIWGRYEVWKEWAADPDPVRASFRDQMELEDISSERGQSQNGAAWRLRSIGYVFRRVDDNTAFDQQPNRVLATKMLEIEINRLLLATPGPAALSVGDGNSAHINTMGRIIGNNGAGILYPAASGNPTTGPANQDRVTGTPRLATVSPYDDSVKAVFGVTYPELQGMADDYVTDPDAFPSPVPDKTIILGDFNSITFDSAQPLSGFGIVHIQGNVTLLPGSNSSFRGLLYVDGNLTVRAPSDIQGAVVCTGNVTVQGSSDYATIAYNEDILNQLRAEIGQYRLSGALRPVISR